MSLERIEGQAQGFPQSDGRPADSALFTGSTHGGRNHPRNGDKPVNRRNAQDRPPNPPVYYVCLSPFVPATPLAPQVLDGGKGALLCPAPRLLFGLRRAFSAGHTHPHCSVLRPSKARLRSKKQAPCRAGGGPYTPSSHLSSASYGTSFTRDCVSDAITARKSTDPMVMPNSGVAKGLGTAFPAGFDPKWPLHISPETAGVKQTLDESFASVRRYSSLERRRQAAA